MLASAGSSADDSCAYTRSSASVICCSSCSLRRRTRARRNHSLRLIPGRVASASVASNKASGKEMAVFMGQRCGDGYTEAREGFGRPVATHGPDLWPDLTIVSDRVAASLTDAHGDHTAPFLSDGRVLLSGSSSVEDHGLLHSR